MAAWAQLRGTPAHAPTWLALARDYAGRDLEWQAGYAARQALRCDPALLPQLDALKIEKWQDPKAGDALLGRASLADAAEKAKQFSAAVRQSPEDWLSWLYLARLGEMPGVQKGDPQVDQALEQAKRLEVLAGESLHWLGVWRLNAGDAQGAVGALSQLVDQRPMRYGSMMYLGEALLRTGNVAAAEKAFTRASLSPNPDFLVTLSSRVYASNYWQEAISVLQKALSLRPQSVPILTALAKIYWEVYELSKAQQCCRAVLAREPGNQDAEYMLAALPGRMGDAKGHLKAVQEKYAAEKNPQSRLASSIAMAALYHDELPPAEVAALHQRMCAPIEAAVKQTKDFANARTTGRRLRIGYVSGDFHRQHPVNIFMLPVLLRHDPARVEVCVYHTGTMHDEYTRKAKGAAQRWMEAAALDDRALREAIIADGVDILVDLAGHTSTHRLGVFAMRAAPVQATFLGYPHSTGLSSIDWLIGDAVVSPAEHATLFSEGLAQLPGSVFCWASVDDYPLPQARPKDAPVVFGSFNNAMKLSPTTLELWAGVLKAVPGSKLLLKAPSLRDTAVRARFDSLLGLSGINPDERLEMRGPTGLADMMQEYGDIDIALDPTPYNGGTTTLQALWMGVPVITLEGGNFVARMGASFLRSLGEPDWVAASPEDYVKRAAALAKRVEALRGARAAMRAKMAASPLCEIEAYVRHLEALYERMWASYCSGGRTRLLAPQP
jgi:protein O-GlcNAc transferase